MSEPQFHPGLEGVVAGETAISTLTGGLFYRGYPVEELAQHASFEEVAYLLLYGELPNTGELAAFNQRLRHNAPVPLAVIDILRRIPPAAGSMDVMRTGASLLAHWDPDQNNGDHDANLRKAERLITQLPVIMAARHRLVQGKEPVAPDRHYSLAENLLRMLRRRDPTPAAVRTLEVSMIVYAELEFNASTFTSRVVVSTLSDIHSAVTAAIGALKGPLHGGANARVLDVLNQVGSSDKAEAWIHDALARKVRIMGFGHRVFKQGDPRATLLKPICVQLAKETGDLEMETMADTIERIVYAQKQLYPNVDWPSARLFYYLGLPVELYTPLFAVSRVIGWCAHIIEQLDHNRLIRPLAK
ncbi:MAG TPA: citrate/2-methylcitrate synthase, partial [Pirellulales bacterium]